MKITTTRCDRPGCEIEFTGKGTTESVWIRVPPLADLGRWNWDLCDRCAEELRRSRIDADLAFGDRLRPGGDASRGE